MLPQTAETIRKQVIAAYSTLAERFSRTRQEPWPEFSDFSRYVKKEDKVLDVGCGNGRLLGSLQSIGVDYFGLDNCDPLLDFARKTYPQAEFQLGDMVSLDWPDNSFDVVFSVASFHHLPSRDLRLQSLAEMRRVVKPDGLVILTVWNLLQPRYWRDWLKSLTSFVCHGGLKYAWNDLWIGWSDLPVKRYYHSFLPGELKRLFSPMDWSVVDFYFSRGGQRVGFLKSWNLCIVAKKTHA